MSGYVLQQRTLNKLRVAVIQQMQPRPSPKIFLPDRFKDSDSVGESSITFIEAESGDQSSIVTEESGSSQDDTVYIEVRPTMPDNESEGALPLDLSQRPPQKVLSSDISADEAAQAVLDADIEIEKPLSRAERRRKIKQEIQELAQSGEPVYYQRRLW